MLVTEDRKRVELNDVECYQNLNIGTTHVLNPDMLNEPMPNLDITNLEHSRSS